MPTITDIRQLKRYNSRFSVHVDGKYAFTVSDLDLSAQGFSIGGELSPDDVNRWRDKGGQAKAFDMAIRFVGIRTRSCKEIHDYLAKKGIEEGPALDVLERLEELGLADDVAFAQGWVEGRLRSRPRSRRVLEQELATKGVSREVVATVLETVFDEASEITSVTAVIEKKQKLPQYRESGKLTAYLLRQGYPYDVVKRALESRES